MLAQGHTTISEIDQEIQERFSIAQNLENVKKDFFIMQIFV